MSSSSHRSSSRKSTSANQKEDEKIKQMMSASGDYYNQKNWSQSSGKLSGQKDTPGPGYKCNRCNQIGGIEGKSHFIYDCPQGKANEGNNVKRSTGIPRSFLQPATADTPGAKINPQGKLL